MQEFHLLGSYEFADFTAGMEFHHSPKIFLCEKSDFDAEGAVEFSSAYDCTPEKANATKKHT